MFMMQITLKGSGGSHMLFFDSQQRLNDETNRMGMSTRPEYMAVKDDHGKTVILATDEVAAIAAMDLDQVREIEVANIEFSQYTQMLANGKAQMRVQAELTNGIVPAVRKPIIQ